LMGQQLTTLAPGTSLDEYDGIHGCAIENKYYPDGAQVPSDPANPCDLCYCIRNHTACVQQECLLSVEGCKPIFQDGVCCPVRYICGALTNKHCLAIFFKYVVFIMIFVNSFRTSPLHRSTDNNFPTRIDR
jgi:hypothetical protein